MSQRKEYRIKECFFTKAWHVGNLYFKADVIIINLKNTGFRTHAQSKFNPFKFYFWLRR